MKETDVVFVPARLPAQLLEYKGFEQGAKCRVIASQHGGLEPEQGAGQAGVAEMQLGVLISRLNRLVCQGGSSSSRNTRSRSVT